MPYIVKAFDSVGQSWVKWPTTSLRRAFTEYPRNDQSYPPVENLSEIVRMVRSFVAAESSGSSEQPALPRSSLWSQENNDLEIGFHIEGHTGSWALSIEQTVVEDALEDIGYLFNESGELTPSTQKPNALTPLYLETVEVYPLTIGLPDSRWAQVGDDIFPEMQDGYT